GSFNTGAGLRTSKDELMFGGVNGWRIYHVDKLKSNDYRPPVQITNFSLYTKPVSVNDETGLLNKVVNQADEIVFDYTQNMFSFNFAALSFRNSDRNTYAYKLEGFDDDWRVIGTQRKAQYTNLSPGDYVFKVKAANNDGVWNEQGASLKITQLPPPWKTWWAYTLYALILLAVVAYLIHKQRMKRKRVEEQNRILEVKVAERTSEIAAKNKNIQSMLSNMRQGLFTVEPDGKVHSEYSAHLEEIFATREIAGRDAAELLFAEANLGADALNQAQEGLKAIIGEDEMNFTFNSHVLPSEYSLTKSAKTQYLQLSWDPIVEDGIVEKLMVSVRDITQLKETEAEAQEQRRELDIITQIIAVDDNKYQELIKTTEVFVAENRHASERAQGLDDAVVALLFRNMHTIKGNCRTYGFSYLTDVVHDVENYYSQLKAGAAAWDSTRLLGDLERVELAFAEYQKVYQEVLGRDSAAMTEAKKGARVAPEILEAVRNYLYRATVEAPDVAANTNVTSAKALIEIAQSETLTNILGDIVQSIPDMAKQLDKPAPTIDISDYNIRIKDAAHNLLTNVFAHLIRNSLDHGIEPAKARLDAHKPESGNIAITALERGERLSITLRDDGRGLNMQRLYEQGVVMGKWTEDASVEPAAVAELIFASGASTKEEVTSISGRGVGMDAVKQFLNNVGGDISLKLDPSASPSDAFVPFEIIITLPKSLYYAISLA
ncbi:MAG TPA: triple tyrosine motif-containing protein, partial [Marinagarivorans sp.]